MRLQEPSLDGERCGGRSVALSKTALMENKNNGLRQQFKVFSLLLPAR